MENRLLILSVKELGEEPPESELWQQVYERLDEERLGKAAALRNRRGKAESAGGGLLLQHLLHRMSLEERKIGAKLTCPGRNDMTFVTEECTLEKLLAELGKPLPVRYTYGVQGKPYLPDQGIFFNLSHSADYVICAVSEREIGADIQKIQLKRTERLADRFFSGEERKLLQSCDRSEYRRELFYRLWTRKEAYGKLTGEGIIASIDKDFSDLAANWMRKLIWEEFDILPGYKIACCIKRQENEA